MYTAGNRRNVTIGYEIRVMLLLMWLAGCSDQVYLPSSEELIEFNNAGYRPASLDIDRLVRADVRGDPYRVVPGDVLELTMPAIVRFVTAEEADGGMDVASPYKCRVNENGSIALPITGDINVAGKTLSQIESEVANLYYPEYVLTRPSVYARVLEYNTAKVSIIGAVQKPGVYSLRSDQMSLVSLLMEAGGIVDEGAAVIRIVRRDRAVSDRQDVMRHASEEAFEYPTGTDAAARRPSAVRYPCTDSMGVKLAFRGAAAFSTVGRLTITQGKELLFAERMNIADPVERQLLLTKLKRSQPCISVAEVDQRLCVLATLLESGSGRHDFVENNVVEVTQRTREFGRNADLRSSHPAVAPQNKLFLSTVDTEKSLWSPVRPAQYSHPVPSRRNDDFNREANLSVATSPSCLASNMSRDEILGNKPFGTVTQNGSPGSERITGSARTQESQSFVLPVKGANIPFADVVLHNGDSVIVERLQLPLFSVFGLVNNPGNFPYPPDVRYNLMQALAFAGGLDRVAEPRYATVYRRKDDGTIVSVVLEVVNIVKGEGLAEALRTEIKPGDIVAVEHTPRTRTKQFLDTVFRINVGTYWQLNDAWEN